MQNHCYKFGSAKKKVLEYAPPLMLVLQISLHHLVVHSVSKRDSVRLLQNGVTVGLM